MKGKVTLGRAAVVAEARGGGGCRTLKFRTVHPASEHSDHHGHFQPHPPQPIWPLVPRPPLILKLSGSPQLSTSLRTIVRRFALQRSNSHHPSKDLLNARIIVLPASVRTLLQMLLHHIICPAMYRLSHVAMLVLHHTSGECVH